MSCIWRPLLVLVFLTSCVVALRSRPNTQPRQCTGGQVWTDCGSPCTRTCHQHDVICATVCRARCQCPNDKPFWHNHQCITRQQCPALHALTTRPCHGGQVWTECGSCTKTCRNPEPPCTLACVVRCECPRDRPIWSNNRCIRRDQCVSGTRLCHGGQVWTDCGSACTRTCHNPDPGCTLACSARCHCPPDKPIWSHHRCIRRDECASVSSHSCNGGKVWNECGSPCTRTCHSQGMICATVCVPKCQCPRDRPVWSHHQCIRSDQCASA